MLKDENIKKHVKDREGRKARYAALILAIIYIPTLLFTFQFIYNRFVIEEQLGHFKYTTLVLVVALIISLILMSVITILNKKYYIRDKQELKSAYVFSFLIYSIIQLLYLTKVSISIEANGFYIFTFIISNALIFLLFIFDYELHKLGVYTDDIEDFVFYSTERKFAFKNDLRKVEFEEALDPLLHLEKLVEKQSKQLRFYEDEANIGKYFTYFIQKYDHNDRVYILIYFSNTGKKNDKVLSLNKHYSKEEYQEKLEKLNNTINDYLKADTE